jgi:hypothetical protein
MASQSNKISATTNYTSKSFLTFRYLATKFPSAPSLIFGPGPRPQSDVTFQSPSSLLHRGILG